MINELDLSTQLVAKILTDLQASGLKTITINPRPYRSMLKDEELEENLYKLDDLFFNTLRWLKDEGVIRFSEITLRGCEGCVLSAYGFQLLGQPFKIGNEITTVSEAARKITSGEGTLIKAGGFLGGLLGGFTKSMSG